MTRIELITDFSVPIWRFFYNSVPYKIPWEFTLRNKQYKNFICIIHLGWCAEYNFANDPTYLIEDEILENYSQNHFICFPTQKGVDLCREHRPRLNPCLISHNSFIDETVYKIDLNKIIKYDMFVSSAFSKYKNLHLLQNLTNVAGIGYGFTDFYREFHPPNVKIINFTDKENTETEKERIEENFRYILPLEIIDLMNSSKIGGIFSTVEGSCFSSGEYLLCGLPVLSCKCTGGRETFYTPENSILCDPTLESVEEGYAQILYNYNHGRYNRQKIRNDHIQMMESQRDHLTNTILDLMRKFIAAEEIPSFNDLKDALKHYHLNNFKYTFAKSYEKQTQRELDAEFILDLKP
jgi:hypothetical protein